MSNLSSVVRNRSILTLFCYLLLSASLAAAEQYHVSGFTEAIQDSTLGVAVTGRVARVLVKAGDSVKQGQPLIELEQRQEQLEVERRKLLLENKTELASISRQLETLTAHLRASQELHRTSGSISREELENQELEEALTRIERQRLAIIEEREQLEYQVARQQLAEKTIKAPFSGIVAEVLVTAGENCDLDTPLLRLVNTSQVQFVVNTELRLSQQLKLGQQIELLFESGQESFKRTAEISFISPVVDPASGLRKIKADFANQDLSVIPGEAGIMQIEISTL